MSSWLLKLAFFLAVQAISKATTPQVPALDEIVRQSEAVDKKLGFFELDVESYTSVPDATGELRKLPVPTHLKAYFDGLKPSKYRLEYQPLVLPHSGGRSGFVAQYQAVVSDGKTCWRFAEYSDVRGPHVRRGEISAFPPPANAAFDSMLTGLAFVLTEARVGPGRLSEIVKRTRPSDLTLKQDANGLWECEFDPVAALEVEPPRLKDFTEPVQIKSRTNRRVKIWLDPEHGFSLKRLENWKVNRETGSHIQMIDSYAVAAFTPLLGKELYFPTSMAYELPSAGHYSRRTEIVIKSVKVKSAVPAKTFSYEFPVDTPVTDTRVDIKFPVGKNPTEVVNDIKKTVEDEKGKQP